MSKEYFHPETGVQITERQYNNYKKRIEEAARSTLESDEYTLVEYQRQPVIILNPTDADTKKLPDTQKRFLVNGELKSRTQEWRHRKALRGEEVPRPDRPNQGKVVIKKSKLAKAIESEYSELDYSNRLMKSYEDLVKRIAAESHDAYIAEVYFDDPKSVAQRNAKLSNIRNLIHVAKGIRELADQLLKDKAALGYDDIDNQLAEHEKLINDAELLLVR